MIYARITSRSNIRSIASILTFTTLAIAMPMVTHIFAGANGGRLFLPMHLFVLVAGLLLGWKSGLIVGALTALISYSITGMPAVSVLPIVTFEVMAYGFLAGYLHQSRNWGMFSSLFGALVLGRIALLVFITIIPTKVVATTYVFSALTAGLIGIAIQLILVPIIYKAIAKYIQDERI